MVSRIDHVMLAAASLEEGVIWAQHTFGIRPSYGGEHLGLGTRNAILSLGKVYLEIIVPDPDQDLADTFGEKLSNLSEPALVTWAVQGNLNKIEATLNSNGIRSIGPNRTERRTPEGELLVWELLFPMAGRFGSLMPFFIDWLDCPHPTMTSPEAGQFKAIRLVSPDAKSLRQVLKAVGLEVEVEVEVGPPSITVEIESDGLVTLKSNAETSTLSLS